MSRRKPNASVKRRAAQRTSFPCSPFCRVACLFARLRPGSEDPGPTEKAVSLSLWRPGLQARMTSPAHRFQISRPTRGRRRIAAAAAQLIATAPAKTVSPFTTAGMPEPSSANCSHVTAT